MELYIKLTQKIKIRKKVQNMKKKEIKRKERNRLERNRKERRKERKEGKKFSFSP